MRAVLVVLAVVVGLAVFHAHAATAQEDPLSLPDDALVFGIEGDALTDTQQQRSLLQGYASPAYPPTYCFNSHIKPVFTAKVAVLLTGKKYGQVVDSGFYVKLVLARINKRLKRYNRRYRLSLSAKITQNTNAFVKYKQQKWFYYDIQLVVGSCGRYKFPLITQLRGDIQPSAPFIKRVRLISYPFK